MDTLQLYGSGGGNKGVDIPPIIIGNEDPDQRMCDLVNAVFGELKIVSPEHLALQMRTDEIMGDIMELIKTEVSIEPVPEEPAG